MESPNNGRATIDDNNYRIVIAVPSQKSWLIIIFIGAWLVMWSFGIIAICLEKAFSNSNDSPPGIVLLLMLCFCAAIMIIPLRIFLWSVMGKEIISVEQGAITLDKKHLLFYKAKSYDLNEARNFRVQEDNSIMLTPFGIRPSSLMKIGNSGIIKFDYGLQTLRFADGIDEAEANYLLQKLRDKKLIN